MASLLETLSDLNTARRAPPRITLPGLNSNGAAPLQFGGRGYGNSSARALNLPDEPGWDLPPGTDINVASNIGQATVARRQLSPDLQGIATVTADSPLPSIHGGDYARLREARALTMPNPSQLGQIQQTNPLAEKQAAERAMGRTVEDTVASMRLSRAYPRTLEGMARMEDRNFRTTTDQANRQAGYNAKLQQIDRQGANANAAIAAEAAALQDRELTQAGIARGALQDQIVADQTRANLNLTIPGQGPDPAAIAQATAEGVRMGLRENLNPNQPPAGFTMPAAPSAELQAAAPPPQAYIDRLRQFKTPEAIAAFERRFGPGTAAKYMQ